ncbi:uncharacterized protein LOC111900549 [Lactuca sativa]|nr:uncharacterized protein LOC111900549 [Lactuca sativa]
MSTPGSSSNPSEEAQSNTVSSGSQASTQPNVRAKKDPAWRYITQLDSGGGKKAYFCTFCKNTYNGGGINRMKQHLAGVPGAISACPSCPGDIKFVMKSSLDENAKKTKEKHAGVLSDTLGVNVDNMYDVIDDDDDDDVQVLTQQSTQKKDGKRKAPHASQTKTVPPFLKRGMHDPSQPSIKATLQSKERWHDTDLALAMWFYDACIPMNAVNSPLFQIAMSKVASMGHGYTGPSYHAMRVTLLKDAKQSVQLIVDSYRRYWAENGCTIMGDGWRDTRQRPLINFMVYCAKGISFIKSVDASDIESNAQTLCNLFSEIVDIVGRQNVVHLVTDNAANYKAAGRLLCEKYPSIVWSPCAAHCMNLIMKDMSEMREVADLVTLASRVTVFVYNHKWPLNWLRKRPGWTEIIRPGATRFGTAFIALKSLCDHKHDLQAMVTSPDFKKVIRLEKAKEVKLIILNESFWNNCAIIVKVMTPMLRLLRICDSDEKPALGYVYEGMYRAKKGIKKLFRNNRELYTPFTNIIKNRWDRMLRKSLHAAAYWLNPVFQYDQENFSKKPEVVGGIMDMIERYSSAGTVDGLTLMDQLKLFREHEGSFGRKLAFASRNTTRPDEWWKLHGGDAPELQKFAIRILSQTASSSGCERNWSVFERIHTKRRNRLEHQRLNDLVYVHYNLRLQNRLKDYKKSYDPIDYESIDKIEFWVVDEIPEGELNYNELENMVEEEPPNYDESMMFESQVSQDDEEDDDGAALEEIDIDSFR